MPVGSYHVPFLVTRFWASDPIAIKLGTLKKGHGMSLQIMLHAAFGRPLKEPSSCVLVGSYHTPVLDPQCTSVKGP